jgi:hypothetical protein
MNELCKDIVISIGDQQITGKEAVVTSFSVNCDRQDVACYSLGSRKPSYIPYQPPVFDIVIELKCIDMSWIDCLTGKETKNIRNKKVDDCSVRELLFAIREKMKK